MTISVISSTRYVTRLTIHVAALALLLLTPALSNGGLHAAESEGREPLLRRPFFGVQLAPVPAEAGVQGVLLESVFAGQSAERGGLRSGDIVVTINGQAIDGTPALLAQLRGRRVGEVLEIGFLRDGERRQARVTLHELPRESYSDIEVIYDELEVGGARRRTILTRPREQEGARPAVLMVGGIGCYSIDVPLGEPQAYVRILNELTRRGYVTMRVEKSGMGDSEGPPCAEQSLLEELAGYVAAARAMPGYPFIDGRQIFLFGHSIGGIHAPLVEAAVAAETPLAGVIAMATVGTSWFAYEMENSRRQAPLWGTPAEEAEAALRISGYCLAAVTVGRRTPAEVVAERPDCADSMQFPAHYSYRRQLVELDLPGSWRKVRAPVLLIYGMSDFLTSAAEHHYIAGLLSSERTGQATVVLIEEMDHYFRRVPSYAESLRASRGEVQAEFDTRIYDVLSGWMEERRAAAPAAPNLAPAR
jgi:uncharacterized protein